MTNLAASRFGRVTLAVFLLALAHVASAQTAGRLAGTVFDTSGGVLPGVTVTATNEGTGAVLTETTNELGAFTFPNLPVGSYKVHVELAGFKSTTYNQVVINVNQEYSLTARLEVGSLEETVEVTAGVSLVKTTTPEVSSTVLQKQVLEIPLANRDVTNLIKMQAGVQAVTNRANTVINGGRPTWTQVTLDGINIQDNFIRTNSLDFLPNRPTSDNVAEFSITSSVQGADAAGGASSVRMVTPSGTNTFRGSVFEFNRDSDLAANSFFNNRTGVAKSDLKRNQFGGRLGGPILKNKLFFFGYYEGFRQTTQTAQNLTVPANPGLLNGEFRYAATDGSVRSVNVMQLSGLPIDSKLRSDFLSKIPGANGTLANNYDTGNSTAARILNTAGYRYNQTDLNNRDQYGFRVDYEMSQYHRIEGVYSYFKETDDRTDLDAVTTDGPLVYTSSDPKRLSLAWRWLASSRFQNEARYGFNLAPVQFVSDWDYSGTGVIYNTALSLANPLGGYGTPGGNTAAFMPQGRYTDTYQFSDNASLILGAHEMQFGGSWQRNRVNPYNFAGIYQTVNMGFSTSAPTNVQLTSAQFPGGISATDLANANALASFLGGIVTSTNRTFNVTDANSGYVPGVPSDENYTLDNIAAYVQDNWRLKPNFTVRAGLKWEYYSPLREDNNLGFLPVLNGGFSDTMLSPNTTLTFTDGDYWNKDLNNFGPTVGFAWDLTKDGKTAVRGGYSLTFVNEEAVTVGRSAARGNTGLTNTPTLSNQYATVTAGVPAIPTPTFLSTRTLANQMATSATAILWGVDPDIQAPRVHQVSIGIQRELPWFMAVEARYVGSFGRDIWRGSDYNQVKISPEFLADFNRGRTNGYLAQQAGLAYSPLYNAAVPGSQQLTLLPSYGVSLTGATAVNNFQTNQVAGLADLFLTSRSPIGLSSLMQNTGIYASQAISNGAFSDYNSLQLELRRQYRNGFFGQVSYTFSDTSTNSQGTAQNRFEAFLDNNRPELATSRAVFHVTHVLGANAIYELPFGQGKRYLDGGGLVDAVFGGWQVAGIFSWQSGSPITFFSGRATFNRAGRSDCAAATGGPSACNSVLTNMSASDVKKLLGVYEANGNIYWIDPKVIDTATGRAVGADNLGNTAGFGGQVFFNPTAGDIGNFGVMNLDGPAQFKIDMALSKRFRLGGRYRLEFKGEAFNLTNTPSFFVGDSNINSTTFGRITSVNIGSRVVQLSARFEF